MARAAEGDARTALAEAERHAQTLAADLNAACAAATAAQEVWDAGSQAEVAALARAEVAERERDGIKDELQAAKAAAA